MLTTELIKAEESSPYLMVVLHGLGDSMEGYRWLPSTLQLPWLNYLLVNAPDDYFGGYSWYDYQVDPDPGVRRSRSLLFDLLDDQFTKGFAPEGTFMFGFSQGCLMTVDVGLRYPKRLAGCVGVSGYVHEPEQALKEQSSVAGQQCFLVTHGTLDPLIPIEKSRGAFEILKAGGIQISWHEFVKEHTIAGMDEVGVIRTFVENRKNHP